MVTPFDQLPGIVSVVSGYIGGHTSNPTYEEVCSETTGHAEAVQITFDPELFSYNKLLIPIGAKLTLQMLAASSMTGAHPIVQQFSHIRISRSWKQKLPSKLCRTAAVSTLRSQRKSCVSMRMPSTLERTITKIIIIKIRCATKHIAKAPGVMRLSKTLEHGER